MDVEEVVGGLIDPSHDIGAERDIVHEMSVHDVEVEPIRASLYSAGDFRAEARKIRR